jgi:tRNA pseudouridine55 synthase
LLVVLLGEATKISDYLMKAPKSYEGTIRFGVVSDTFDSQGRVEEAPEPPVPLTLELIRETARRLTGEIEQSPPPFSARKVHGKKLYQYARKGEQPPPVEPRRVHVREFEILNFDGNQSEFGVDCSSGTYIRSLAHDLGRLLGTGAILTELRRTDIGRFGIEQAHTLESLEAMTPAQLRTTVQSIPSALPMQVLHVSPGAETWLRRGQAIPHSLLLSDDDAMPPRRNAMVALCRVNGEPIAIARVDPAPLGTPPRSISNPIPPWYHPVKQFDLSNAANTGDDQDEDEE